MTEVMERMKTLLPDAQVERISDYGVIYFTIACEFAREGCLQGHIGQIFLADGEKNSDLSGCDPDFLKNIMARLADCDTKGRAMIQQKSPNEDASLLVLDDIIIDPGDGFAIGYDTGERQFGAVYIYVHFSETFEMEEELYYEVY